MVFSVIIENIKSFFAKENELEKNPKKIPSSAAEIFELPDNEQPKDDREFHAKIVGNNLPPKEAKAEPSKPIKSGLKYSGADLKKKLAEQKSQSQTIFNSQDNIRQRPVESHEESIVAEDDVFAFEEAINSLQDEFSSQEVTSNNTLNPNGSNSNSKKNDYLSESRSTRKALEGGFFSEYEKHLTDKNYKINDEALNGDALIKKMNDYHSHKGDGEEYYIHKNELELAIKKKISDLKEYEYEWFDLKEREESINRAKTVVEDEIKRRTAELKKLVSQINSKTLILPHPDEKKEVKQSEQKLELEVEEKQGEKQELKQEVKEEVKASEEKVEETKEPEQSKVEEKETKEVQNNDAFYLADGRPINNLQELKDALQEMPDSVFYKHVAPDRNDFANWIADSLKREEIAIEIRKTTNKYEMINKLNHKWV